LFVTSYYRPGGPSTPFAAFKGYPQAACPITPSSTREVSFGSSHLFWFFSPLWPWERRIRSHLLRRLFLVPVFMTSYRSSPFIPKNSPNPLFDLFYANSLTFPFLSLALTSRLGGFQRHPKFVSLIFVGFETFSVCFRTATCTYGTPRGVLPLLKNLSGSDLVWSPTSGNYFSPCFPRTI